MDVVTALLYDDLETNVSIKLPDYLVTLAGKPLSGRKVNFSQLKAQVVVKAALKWHHTLKGRKDTFYKFA